MGMRAEGPASASGGSPTKAASPTSPGAAVRDGGFEFTVLDTQRVQRVGDVNSPGLSIDAHGVFVVITLSIRNTGDAPNTFLDRDQTLVDNRGNEYAVSNAADIYGNLNVRSTRMAPGEALTVHIAFDVPSDAVARTLILRGSSSSNGVALALS
ncbi:MAG: DUF4352 domain-containing protein [Mycobacterium sp.]